MMRLRQTRRIQGSQPMSVTYYYASCHHLTCLEWESPRRYGGWCSSLPWRQLESCARSLSLMHAALLRSSERSAAAISSRHRQKGAETVWPSRASAGSHNHHTLHAQRTVPHAPLLYKRSRVFDAENSSRRPYFTSRCQLHGTSSTAECGALRRCLTFFQVAQCYRHSEFNAEHHALQRSWLL